MKIALFSDVHGNLPALEAVFDSIDNLKPDAVYCLGDLVGYNIWPNEVIDHVRKRNIATVAGNHDLKVSKNFFDGGKTLQDLGKNYAYAIIGESEKAYLLTLPAHIRLEYKIRDDKFNILFVHGSPRSVDEYLLQDMEEALLLEIMRKANADILCFGHSHKPYHRIVKDGAKYRHAINIGSVGKPKDGNPKACYVQLSVNPTSSLTNGNDIRVDFIRVEYDIEKAAKAVEESPLPNEFADMLRRGV